MIFDSASVEITLFLATICNSLCWSDLANDPLGLIANLLQIAILVVGQSVEGFESSTKDVNFFTIVTKAILENELFEQLLELPTG